MLKRIEKIKEIDKKDFKEEILEISDYIVHLSFDSDTEQKLFKESKDKGENIGGTYSVIKHKPHTSKGQSHLHIYAKKNELFSINKDGTAHDNSHKTTIPNEVFDGLKKYFPNFELPKNRYIEHVEKDNLITLREITRS